MKIENEALLAFVDGMACAKVDLPYLAALRSLISRAPLVDNRPVRFYCQVCSKEIWDGMSLSEHSTETLGELMERMTCSDCLLAALRKSEEGGK